MRRVTNGLMGWVRGFMKVEEVSRIFLGETKENPFAGFEIEITNERLSSGCRFRKIRGMGMFFTGWLVD